MLDKTLQQTALFPWHKEQKAKMVVYGTWKMPISYESVLAEHKHVREKVGLFDVSHMGEFFVRGNDAFSFLQMMTINDISNLSVGQGQYTAMCNESGGMIDDLILYRTADKEFLLCVNAGNIDKDFAWLNKYAKEYSELEFVDESSKWSQIAIQGPLSVEVLESFLDNKDKKRLNDLPYTQIAKFNLFGEECLLARTGYTGEKGFELYMPPSCAIQCWQGLMDSGLSQEIKAIGLGARDTLRLEACYLLYGNDMNENVSPLEAGIAWATKLNKGEFVGSKALKEQKEAGVKRRVYGFQLEEQGIPRSGMTVYLGDEELGQITSGSVLPTCGGAGGLAFLKTGRVKVGDQVEIDIRGKRKKARLVKKPFYTARAKD